MGCCCVEEQASRSGQLALSRKKQADHLLFSNQQGRRAAGAGGGVGVYGPGASRQVVRVPVQARVRSSPDWASNSYRFDWNTGRSNRSGLGECIFEFVGAPDWLFWRTSCGRSARDKRAGGEGEAAIG